MQLAPNKQHSSNDARASDNAIESREAPSHYSKAATSKSKSSVDLNRSVPGSEIPRPSLHHRHAEHRQERNPVSSHPSVAYPSFDAKGWNGINREDLSRNDAMDAGQAFSSPAESGQPWDVAAMAHPIFNRSRTFSTDGILLQHVRTFSGDLQDELDFPFSLYSEKTSDTSIDYPHSHFENQSIDSMLSQTAWKESQMREDDASMDEDSRLEFSVPALAPTHQGRVVIQTAHGPAILLNKQLEMKSHNFGSLGIVTSPSPDPQPPTSSGKKFQRWSDDEDDLLSAAIRTEGKGPYNWKRISNKYLHNKRSAMQCKSRWTKVSQQNS